MLIVKQCHRFVPLSPPENTTAENPQPTWRALPYVQGVSQLIARYLRPCNLNIAHKPTESLWKALVQVKGPLLTQRWRNVVYSIACSECPSAYVGQIGRRFATCMKEHQSAVRRQDENSLLTLYCITTSHAFDWTSASVVGNGSMKRTRELIEAWKTTPTCGNQGYKALRAYWIRKRT